MYLSIIRGSSVGFISVTLRVINLIQIVVNPPVIIWIGNFDSISINNILQSVGCSTAQFTAFDGQSF